MIPTVISETPAANATNVPLATTVTATFNESVLGSSITTSTFQIKDSNNNTVASTLSYNDSNHTATLTPNAPLAASTTYTATVSGATDTGGNMMTGPVSWSFATTATVPTVTSESPAAGASGVARNTTVTATFSEAVQASTISFNLQDPSGTTVSASVSYNSSNYTVTLTPSSSLAYATTYTATISGAQDLAGNVMSTVSWSFTSASITIGDTTVENSNDYGNGNTLVVQQATLSQAATIQSLSLYVNALGGNLRLGLYDDNAGSPGALKCSTNEFTPTSTGWNTQNVVTQVSLTAGTYWLAYLPQSNSLGYKANPSSGTAHWVNFNYGPLPATFPSGARGNSGQWSFYATLNTAADTTPPTVTSQNPGNGATGVARNTTVTATFSEAVQASTISFNLQDPSGTTVSASVSYNSSNYTVTLTPSSSLAYATTYTATISGAQDLAGNVMSTVSWSFTSASITIGDTTVESTRTTTVTAIPLVVQKATLSQAATIQSLSFYVNALGGNLRLGLYADNAGSPGALKASTNEFTPTSTGWNTQNVVTPVSLTAGTYWLAYLPQSNSLGFKANPGSGTALWTNFNYGPLPATFPSGASGDSGQWSFYATLNTAADTTPPTVTSQNPGNGATGVARNTTVTATFSEAVQASTISFNLQDPSGTTVSASVSYNSSNYTVTLTPSSSLAYATTYTATISEAQDPADLGVRPS